MAENKETAKKSGKPENGLLNILFNVIIPVVILHKLSERFGSMNALFIALSFPLGYGIFDLLKKRKWNPLSILGFVNVSVTGGLAVLGLGGIWFSIKEAFFPFIIGAFVWWSSTTQKPFIKTILLNPQLMDLDLINFHLKEKNVESHFDEHIKISTRLLACSFLLSACLNFMLALRIFTPIDSNLVGEQRSLVLNGQIAQMTTWSAMVIMIPSMLFLIFILWYLIRGIKKLTGLDMDKIVRN